MTLQLKNKKWRIVYVISFLLFSFTGNAAIPEEPEEEILFVTSYNSDTKYTYDNINTFVETYRQLGGKYSTIVENMNVTDLNQSRKWKKRLTKTGKILYTCIVSNNRRNTQVVEGSGFEHQ